MLLLRKYIIKELLLYFSIIIFLLFFISSSDKFIGLLTKVAVGKLQFSMVCRIMLLYVPEILSLLMPLSLFVATLFIVSKLYADNEITILFVSGLNWHFLIDSILRVAGIIAIITAILTLVIAPNTVKIREDLLYKGETLGIINAIIPGRFQTINDGKQVFYVGNIDQNNQLNNIFIASSSNTEDSFNNNINIKDGYNHHTQETLVITAKSGNLQSLKNPDGGFVVLKNGQRYAGITGTLNFSIINFLEYGRQLLPKVQELPNVHKMQKTKDLFYSKEPGEIAELAWRIAMPVSVLVLTILAISLAKVEPRQGRFAKFLPAILLYIIYCNSMIFMRRLLSINAFNHILLIKILGMWSVHLIFLTLAALLLFQASGWFLYFKKKWYNSSAF